MKYLKLKRYNSVKEATDYLKSIGTNIGVVGLEYKEITEVSPKDKPINMSPFCIGIPTKEGRYYTTKMYSVYLKVDNLDFRGNIVKVRNEYEEEGFFVIDMFANLNFNLNVYNVGHLKQGNVYKLGIELSGKTLLDFNNIRLEEYIEGTHIKEFGFNFEYLNNPEGKYTVDFKNNKVYFNEYEIDSLLTYEDKTYVGVKYNNKLSLNKINEIVHDIHDTFFIKTKEDIYMVNKYDTEFCEEHEEYLRMIAPNTDFKGVFYDFKSLELEKNKAITEIRVDNYFDVDILFSLR